MPSVKKNLFLEISYQIISVSLPLITAPYLARVLGAENLGIFSYTNSVVGYFMLFAALGTYSYGTRTIASIKNDLSLLNTNFWSIYTLQLLTSLIMIGSYIGYLAFFCYENFTIALIQGLLLVNCLVDITWLFRGLENFTITVTRSLIVRIISLILILVLVKRPADLWLYTLIMAGDTVISQSILWCNIPSFIHFQCPTWAQIRSHVIPNLMLFFPILAISVYHLMDKTMLGSFSSYEQTGFYYNADKLVNIPLRVLKGIGVVLLPHMSFLIHQKLFRQANNLFLQTICGIAVLGVAMAFGIAATAPDFVPFFFGPGYEPCIFLTYLFAPIFIIKSFSQMASSQFLVPRHLEKQLTISVVFGAITNFTCNIILIPRYGAVGATCGTLAAELVACLWQYKFIYRIISLRLVIKKLTVYLLIGSCMWYAIHWIRLLPLNTLPLILAEITLGGTLYILLCTLYWKFSQDILLQQSNRIIRGVLLKIRKIKTSFVKN